MAIPQTWLKAAIEEATDVQAWPVAMTAATGTEPPYVIYQRIATTRETLLEDLLGDPAAPGAMPIMARFSVEVYATSNSQAWEIAGQIAAAVHNFKATLDGLTIDRVEVTDERDSPGVYLDGQEKPTFVVEQELTMYFLETEAE